MSAVPARLMTLFRPSVQPYLISWFRYDPIKLIQELDIPVLIVQGSTDLQVLEADASALKSAYPVAVLALIPGMNHVLKDAPLDRMENLKTYSNPTAPLSVGAVRSIVGFLSK